MYLQGNTPTDYLGGPSLTYPEAENQQPSNFHFERNIFMREVSITRKWKTTAVEAATFT